MWVILGPLVGLAVGVAGYAVLKPAPLDYAVRTTGDELKRLAVVTALTNAGIAFKEQKVSGTQVLFLVKEADGPRALKILESIFGYH